MRTLTFILTFSFALQMPAPAFAQVDSSERLIASATAPLPAEYRSDAAVWQWNEDGTLTLVREGENDMVCLADDPSDERFHVACYHVSLEPFMERGRELRRQGKPMEEVRAIREAEARDGQLTMPDRPAALYSLSGELDVVNPSTGEVSGASRLYVVYLPYATEEETGLSSVPAPGKPWLMDPGKPWAHIMLMAAEPGN